jgi:hypothetical protein
VLCSCASLKACVQAWSTDKARSHSGQRGDFLLFICVRVVLGISGQVETRKVYRTFARTFAAFLVSYVEVCTEFLEENIFEVRKEDTIQPTGFEQIRMISHNKVKNPMCQTRLVLIGV